MKIKTLILAVTAGLLVCACIPSVNPFYTPKDVTFDARLLNEWHTKDKQKEPQHWRFEPGENESYQLTVTDDKGKQGQFKAIAFTLKGHQFLDLIPTQCDYATNQVELVGCAMFPGHLLIHVAQLEPDLKMSFFDFDWLEKHLEAHPGALDHYLDPDDGRLLLTAKTYDLQRFVLLHMDGGELFSDYAELQRSSSRQPEQATPSN